MGKGHTTPWLERSLESWDSEEDRALPGSIDLLISLSTGLDTYPPATARAGRSSCWILAVENGCRGISPPPTVQSRNRMRA